MGATIASTARGTNNGLSNRQVIDMSDRISMLSPNEAPLTVLTKKLRTESCHNYRFDWMEDDIMGRWATMSAQALAAATTLTVDSTSIFAVNDLIKVPRTGEVLRVTAIASATQLTVVRGYGATAAADINSGEKVLCIGNAIMQGDAAPGEKYNNEVPAFNYTQIFRTPFSVTNTYDATKLYGGKELARLRMKKGIEHKLDLEYAFMFGERKLDTTAAQPRTTTAGVLQFLAGTQNVATKSKATITEDDVIDWLQVLFAKGSNQRAFICSPTWITLINKWAKTGNNRINYTSTSKTLGIDINKYMTPHGELALIKHPLLVNGYDGYGIALDLAELAYRPLNGRDTALKTNIQNNDEDGVRDEYITEAGLELRQPKKHGMYILT